MLLKVINDFFSVQCVQLSCSANLQKLRPPFSISVVSSSKPESTVAILAEYPFANKSTIAVMTLEHPCKTLTSSLFSHQNSPQTSQCHNPSLPFGLKQFVKSTYIHSCTIAL